MKRQIRPLVLPLLLAFLSVTVWWSYASANTVAIGSKKFTESVILGEILSHLVRSEGVEAIHRRDLGGTRILWKALLNGDIDIYPDYTGTIRFEILASEKIGNEEQLLQALTKQGIRMSRPFGFNNTFAIGMQEEVAERLNIRRISDLTRHPELVFGFTEEFMNRADGWPGLKNRYGLPQKNVRGIDHDLAYRGMESGTLQVIDLYSTDAEIQYYQLRTLEDDHHYFPDYQGVLLYRAELEQRMPQVVATLKKLEGLINEEAMVAMNAQAKLDRVPETRVAADFLQRSLGLTSHVTEEGRLDRLLQYTQEHLALVGASLSVAILVAIPLGIFSAYQPNMGQLILGVAGVIQTIPSLALLVFMIPLLGIGGPPAIVALFFYSLLPIVRNTYTGLHDIPIQIRESAEALGLPATARLKRVELPMASRTILAGIKTSAVINVGTATLGALIGAGGYGQPIIIGIRLDNIGLILEGAVPAALLALMVQGLFELAERIIVPKGLRLKTNL